jgi:hypothetical protein
MSLIAISALSALSMVLGQNRPLQTVVVRSQALAGARFHWTNNTNIDGTVIVRGTNTPVDGTCYNAGDTIGTSKVMCVVANTTSGSRLSCDEVGPGPATSGGATYRFYHYDCANCGNCGQRDYSSNNATTEHVVPAKPTLAGMAIYKRMSMGNTQMGLMPGAGGYVVFGDQNVPGSFFFINSDGTEKRAPFTTAANETNRRAYPVTFSAGGTVTGTWVLAADGSDDGATSAYRISPTGGTGATVGAGGPMMSGFAAVLRDTVDLLGFFTLHTGYQLATTRDAAFYGTSLATGNYIASAGISLGNGRFWSLNLPANHALLVEANIDYYNGFVTYPITGNTATVGGVRGFNLRDGAGGAFNATTPPGPPAGWSASHIITNKSFQAQCRTSNDGAVLYCGSTDGTIYAINPLDGTVITSTTVTNATARSVLSLFAIKGDGLVYTTRASGGVSGVVGRLTYNGSAFTKLWEVQPDGADNDAASPAQVVFNKSAVYTFAEGKLFRLDLATGANAVITGTNPLPLDGAQGTEVGMDALTNTLYVTTSVGTTWILPVTLMD